MNPTEIEPPQIFESTQPAPIAPIWHTVILVAAIVAVSIRGASHFSSPHQPVNRLATYGFTGAMQLVLLAWVVFGLRLRKISLRSLLGGFSLNFRSIVTDLGVALIFWVGSMTVLGTLSVAWSAFDFAMAQRTVSAHASSASQLESALAADPERLQALHVLAELAPANEREIAAWALLCLIVGFTEEVVFRGYLQRQFIGWARGSEVWGIVCSAIVFGAAHAYQGLRGIVLLSVFGALFGVLALYRRSLRAGMFTHAGHDLMAGLALAFLHSMHQI